MVVVREKEGRKWVKQVKETKRYKLPVINKSCDVKYNTGNTDKNIATTLYGER